MEFITSVELKKSLKVDITELLFFNEFRVFSCPENRGSAPNLGQMGKVLQICSDFSFSSKTQRVPYKKSGHNYLLDKNEAGTSSG